MLPVGQTGGAGTGQLGQGDRREAAAIYRHVKVRVDGLIRTAHDMGATW
jgi:hypothetical protein